MEKDLQPYLDAEAELVEKLRVAREAITQFDLYNYCGSSYSIFARKERDMLDSTVTSLESELDLWRKDVFFVEFKEKLDQAKTNSNDKCGILERIQSDLANRVDFAYTPVELPEVEDYYDDWASLGSWAKLDNEIDLCYKNAYDFASKVDKVDLLDLKEVTKIDECLDDFTYIPTIPSFDDLIEEQEKIIDSIDVKETAKEIEDM